MKKLITSIAIFAASIVATAANASPVGEIRIHSSGLKNYPTVSEVRALEQTVISSESIDSVAFNKVKWFDANNDGQIVLREVLDMVNANCDETDYSSIDDVTEFDIATLKELFSNLERYI